jgi:hypothetical protein
MIGMLEMTRTKSKEIRNTMIDCNFCGQNHPRKKELCPAWQKRCQACDGRNHFPAVSRKTNSHRGVHKVSEQREIDSSEIKNFSRVSLNTLKSQ